MRAYTRYGVKLLKPGAVFKDALNTECLLSSVICRIEEISVAYPYLKLLLMALILWVRAGMICLRPSELFMCRTHRRRWNHAGWS